MPESKTDGHRVEAEIFSVGEWNGERFSRRDLEEIARNFETMKDRLRPPLKFGHDENQTLLNQSDGDPSLGWVDALRVRGEKLLATFSGVPTVVYEAIRKGLYQRVSAELYFNVRQNGKKLGKVLKAVALLGADLPAVTNLRELGAYLAIGQPASLGAASVRSFSWPAHQQTITPIPPEESPMPDQEIPEEVQAEMAELRAYREHSEAERETAVQQRKSEAFRSIRDNAVSFCDGQVREGRLSPNQRHLLVREIEGNTREFSAGAPLRVSFSWVRKFISESAKALPEGEIGFSQSGAPPEGHTDENPSQTLARQAANKMNELNLSYTEASEYVLRTEPALAQAYREFTLNPNL